MSSRPQLVLVLGLILGGLLSAQDRRQIHTTPAEVPVLALDVGEAFAGLTEREKLYAHWMSEASWRGNLITFGQLSPESPDLLEFFLRLFSVHPVTLRKAATAAGLDDRDLADLETYAARVFSNCGNYLSFGDQKFIPRVEAAKVEALVLELALADESEEPSRLQILWRALKEPMYSLAADRLGLGLEDEGVSAYYGEDVSRAEIELVARFMRSIDMEAWNTRIDKDEKGGLRLWVAAAIPTPAVPCEFEGREIQIVHGDFADALAGVVEALTQALRYAANDEQRKMILAYIDHFNGGDIDAHKRSQRHWVADQGPVVETNIGFIETYRDPTAVRAEWEGLVAVVNKEQTRKFAALVDAAPRLIPLLPWPKAFEKDGFRRPDFTSLEVLAFASSGIPLGINIPNYDDIRQRIGFKNVSLGNVSRARGKSDAKISFVRDRDQEVYARLADPSFEVQVGLHELLGHGSGKLLEQDAAGKFNFAKGELVDPFTEKPVASWYHPGETWGSKFTTIASSYEECRAEAVGLYLGLDHDVLRIFGHEGEEADDVIYVNWLAMARAGLSSLTFYDPDRGVWGQAHMQARFALLQVMLRAGDGLCRLEQDAAGDWFVDLDRTKIATVGKKAIGDFLARLNVYKAMGDADAGRALYLDHTRVDDRFLAIRSYVLANAKPRHVWVQPVTALDAEGKVVLREYPATIRGVIDSFVDRYAGLYGLR
ncbi:MAG: hypothetical protein H6807_03090 [Planctomycetes bacterium]|nr:hypothetical protein [Planctomycetota bacterium]